MKKNESLMNIAKKFVKSDVAENNEISAYILGVENGKTRVIQELKKLGIAIPDDFGKSNTSAVTQEGGDTMENKEFQSIHIDLEKGIYEINDESLVGKQITKLKLKFNGCWELAFEKRMAGPEKKNS